MQEIQLPGHGKLQTLLTTSLMLLSRLTAQAQRLLRSEDLVVELQPKMVCMFAQIVFKSFTISIRIEKINVWRRKSNKIGMVNVDRIILYIMCLK